MSSQPRGAPASPLHFILRYSDTLRGVDTYAEHKELETRQGSVWWGKFGVGAAPAVVQQAKAQIAAGVPTFVYLAQNRSLAHRGQLVDILGGGAQTRYRPKDRQRIPSYYRSESCTVWFKLTDLAPLSAAVKRGLVLYRDHSAKPQLNSMKGLIYVMHGMPRVRRSKSFHDPLDWPERDF